MDDIGINGFVLFNRLFEPDIDPDKIQYSNLFNLSNKNDSRLSLRFTSLLSGNIRADICASTGIFDGYDVIKMILAGASCIQCVSTLYKNGISQISKMLSEITEWAGKNNYKSLGDFKGKLSKKNIKDPFFFGRNQYIDILLNKEPIIIERKM
jgi:dihydroorotate dehydrogenase (fumarate)